jgi:outer membrane protein
MNRVLLTIVLVNLSLVSFAQRWTLQQCIDTALKNNIELRQSRLQNDAASVRYKQSKSNLLPNINGSISHGINQGRSIDPFTNSYVNQNISYANYGIGGDLPLFNGFSLRNEIRRFGYALNAATLEAEQTRVDVTLDVILAYLQVLNNEDQLQIAKQQVAVTQKQIERLEVLNKQGAINPPQLHELRGQLKDNELSALNSQAAMATAKLQLAQLMNVPYTEGMQLERAEAETVLEQPTLSAGEIYDKAVNQLAGVKAAGLRRKSAEAAVRSFRGAILPTLSLNTAANTTYSSNANRDQFLNTTDVPTTSYVMVNGNSVPVISKRNNFITEKIPYSNQLKNNIYSNFGLTLRVPILNSFQSRNQVKLAQIELKNVELLEENTKVQLKQQVEQAHLNLVNSWNRYKLVTEQVAAFKEAFRAAEIRFNAGVGTSVDYILSKNNYDRASQNQVIAQYDYLLRKEVIRYYTGAF